MLAQGEERDRPLHHLADPAVRAATALGRERGHQLLIALVPAGRVEDRPQEPARGVSGGHHPGGHAHRGEDLQHVPLEPPRLIRGDLSRADRCPIFLVMLEVIACAAGQYRARVLVLLLCAHRCHLQSMALHPIVGPRGCKELAGSARENRLRSRARRSTAEVDPGCVTTWGGPRSGRQRAGAARLTRKRGCGPHVRAAAARAYRPPPRVAALRRGVSCWPSPRARRPCCRGRECIRSSGFAAWRRTER